MRANKSRNVVLYHHLICVLDKRHRVNSATFVKQTLRTQSSDALTSDRVERSPSSRRASRQRDFAAWYFVKSIE